jgi:hypothetical protein
VIGLQVGAASLGVALVPALGGVLAEQLSLEVIPPFLALAGLVLLALHEGLVGGRGTGAGGALAEG